MQSAVGSTLWPGQGRVNVSVLLSCALGTSTLDTDSGAGALERLCLLLSLAVIMSIHRLFLSGTSCITLHLYR